MTDLLMREAEDLRAENGRLRLVLTDQTYAKHRHVTSKAIAALILEAANFRSEPKTV